MSLPPTLSPTRRGLFFAVCSALAFSTLGIWGKLATAAGLHEHTTLAWRFGLVALALIPLAGRRLTRQQVTLTLGIGLLYAAATTCYFMALERISAGTTSLLLYLAPAFVVLIGWRLGQVPGRAQLGAVALAALGLGLVIGIPSGADRSVVGLLAGAGAGLCYALYLLASERYLSGTSPLAATGYVALSSGAWFLGLAALQGTFSVPHGLQQWGVITGMAVVATLIAVPTLYAAVARIGAARTSITSTLEPLFTVLLAAAVLHEHVQPAVMLGGALILSGAMLAQWRPRAAQPDPAADRPTDHGELSGTDHR